MIHTATRYPIAPIQGSGDALETRLAPLREALGKHPLYPAIRTVAQVRIFMEHHVFAVWDFMSLLKALQRTLTCVTLPWVPTAFPMSRRFINEIVLGEESDEYEGRPLSHFELYLEAMDAVGAETSAIRDALNGVAGGLERPRLERAPVAAREFVESTFRVIRQGSPAAQAAAFAFGREDAIPGMFRSLVEHLNRETSGRLDPFEWYLRRHIEVDGEDHGPLALRMVADLCGGDPALWEEATQAAEDAMRARLRLWDGVLAAIQAT